MIKAIDGDPMIYLQNWIDQVNPMAALPSIANPFSDREHRRQVRGQPAPMAAALSNAEARLRRALIPLILNRQQSVRCIVVCGIFGASSPLRARRLLPTAHCSAILPSNPTSPSAALYKNDPDKSISLTPRCQSKVAPAHCGAFRCN
jgi:hypothetical protein